MRANNNGTRAKAPRRSSIGVYARETRGDAVSATSPSRASFPTGVASGVAIYAANGPYALLGGLNDVLPWSPSSGRTPPLSRFAEHTRGMVEKSSLRSFLHVCVQMTTGRTPQSLRSPLWNARSRPHVDGGSRRSPPLEERPARGKRGLTATLAAAALRRVAASRGYRPSSVQTSTKLSAAQVLRRG